MVIARDCAAAPNARRDGSTVETSRNVTRIYILSCAVVLGVASSIAARQVRHQGAWLAWPV
jgi:hypothetical protein